MSKIYESADWTEDVDPTVLIPKLLKQFYGLGWVTGTGGGISIKSGNDIYVAPSGVQKERVEASDLFKISMSGDLIEGPPAKKRLKQSQCTPLFLNAYRLRGAGAVIHTHSKAALLATILYPGREFTIRYQEMIKGIRRDTNGKNLRYDELLAVPIIENTCNENELEEAMAAAMEDYPECPAVLVRRHGIYVWGPTWQKAKIMCECLDYLFEVAADMKRLGIDPCAAPDLPKDGYLSAEHKPVQSP
ncbi:methylthioribulose-1-phosphate dehydratase-like [Watersipora subatra]|uniref:methylthioribulose-1-phosphate dehydratase-like n=1 Tax=Watersipora subatra TaxID=2589382 RepID=UPI00355B4072